MVWEFMATGKLKFRVVLGGMALVSGLLLGRGYADMDDAKPATQPATHPAAQPRIVVNEQVALDFFQKYEPEVYGNLKVLKEKDRAKYEGLMKDFYPELGRLLALQRKNEPLFKITMEDRQIGFKALQLARNMQSGKLSAEETEKAKTDLTAMLSRQFDLRQEIRQAALDEQRDRLEEIQKTYDTLMDQFNERAKSKDDLIKQRMSDLMNKNPKVEW